MLMFVMSFGVFADQRIDRDTNNCHISLDPNDDDTEMDLSCTELNSGVYREVNADGVRIANGWYFGFIRVPLDQAVNGEYFVEGQDIYRKGQDSAAADKPYVVAANTSCNLVRSNYQQNTGSDDQNQTEYVSNDYELKLKWFNKFGDERGHFGIWQVEMYCRNGTTN